MDRTLRLQVSAALAFAAAVALGGLLALILPVLAQPETVVDAVPLAAPASVVPGPVLEPAAPPRTVPVFRDCAAAHAAGAAPLRRGDPGYRPELDRDGDGVACEAPPPGAR